jgi:hypothetical protein
MDRQVQMLYKQDRFLSLNEKHDIQSIVTSCDHTFDDVTANTVPNVPCPINVFNRIVSNGMRNSFVVRSENI